MKALVGALVAVAVLAGCAPPAPRCAGLAGKPMLTAELFFDRTGSGADWRASVADAVTPRFPAGFTLLDGHGPWRQPATGRIIAEPSTVLVVVAEPGEATLAALEAIRTDYRRRFHQDSVGLALTESCATF
jgi:hypothetical protein